MVEIQKVGSTGEELDPITAEAIRQATKNGSLYQVVMTREECKRLLAKGVRVVQFADKQQTVIMLMVRDPEKKEAGK
jgi:hypothetical protein